MTKPRMMERPPLPTIPETDHLKSLRVQLRDAETDLAAVQTDLASVQGRYAAAAKGGDLIAQIETSHAAETLPTRLAVCRVRCLELEADIAATERALMEPERNRLRMAQRAAQSTAEDAKATAATATQLAYRAEQRCAQLRDRERTARQRAAEITHEATTMIDRDAKRLLSVA